MSESKKLTEESEIKYPLCPDCEFWETDEETGNSECLIVCCKDPYHGPEPFEAEEWSKMISKFYNERKEVK